MRECAELVRGAAPATRRGDRGHQSLPRDRRDGDRRRRQVPFIASMTWRTIGAAISAPWPASSTSATTTYCGLLGREERRRTTTWRLALHLRGTGLARDATRRPNGKPWNASYAVPFGSCDRAVEAGQHRVRTSYGSNDDVPRAFGAIVSTSFSVIGSTHRRRRRAASTSVPLFANVARTRSASCSGVTSRSPWPTARYTLSPGYQMPLSCARLRRLVVRVGERLLPRRVGNAARRFVELDAGLGAEAELARLLWSPSPWSRRRRSSRARTRRRPCRSTCRSTRSAPAARSTRPCTSPLSLCERRGRPMLDRCRCRRSTRRRRGSPYCVIASDGDQLERRARRVLALRRPVEQRVAGSRDW